MRLPSISRLAAHGAAPTAENIPLSVVYEDDDLLVVNKPPGQVSHPAFRNPSRDTPQRTSWHADGRWQPALVDRLDKDTSGLVLVAKDQRCKRRFSGSSSATNREGLPGDRAGQPPSKGTIDLALDRDPWDRRRVIVRDRGGVPSVTRFERLSITVAPGRALRC